VRISTIVAAAILLLLVALNVFVGCASKQVVCTVSPIDIEETKSDSRDLDKELGVVRERLKKAQDDLAGWQKRLADRRAELPQLEAELERQKKMSGVTYKIDIDVQPRATEPDDIEIVPRSE
jgi:septal ring factor EnvC (AmiA/AmiB activator)